MKSKFVLTLATTIILVVSFAACGDLSNTTATNNEPHFSVSESEIEIGNKIDVGNAEYSPDYDLSDFTVDSAEALVENSIEVENATQDVEYKETVEPALQATVHQEVVEHQTSTELSSDGNCFSYINNNVPNFRKSEITTSSFEIYSDLDSLGRCGVAFANICTDTMPTEPRGEIGMIKPSGWHTVRYDNIVDGKYLYNRCHLIAYQLAGENANEKNLITGTRWLNVVGMLAFESQVAEYVRETGNHVLYRSTPVFEGDNLVASGVQLEALSVEDGGAGVSFNVFIYNIQPGIEIDYKTGDSKALTEVISEAKEQDDISNISDPVSEAVEDVTLNEATYILNTNTKKFHYPYCSSVSEMSDKNKKEFAGSRDEAISAGFKPCGRCKP